MPKSTRKHIKNYAFITNALPNIQMYSSIEVEIKKKSAQSYLFGRTCGL